MNFGVVGYLFISLIVYTICWTKSIKFPKEKEKNRPQKKKIEKRGAHLLSSGVGVDSLTCQRKVRG